MLCVEKQQVSPRRTLLLSVDKCLEMLAGVGDQVILTPLLYDILYSDDLLAQGFTSQVFFFIFFSVSFVRNYKRKSIILYSQAQISKRKHKTNDCRSYKYVCRKFPASR